VFRGRFTLAAAEQVAGGEGIAPAALPDLLVSLVDRSMISAQDGGHRMLETLREYGLRQLRDRGGLEACLRRHCAWAAGMAETHASRLYADGVDAVGQALAPYRPDLDAAIDLALEDGAAVHALPLATALGVLDFGLGDSTRSRTRLARALRLDAPARARVPALTVQSALLTLHGLVEQGEAIADEAIALAADAAWSDRARAFRGSARVLGGDVEGALEDFDGLEDRLTMRGELWVRGFASGWLGFVRMMLGDLVEAERLSRRAVQAFDRCDDVWGLLTSSVNLARVEVALGAYDAAAETLGRALRIGEERVPQRVGPILHDLGLVELRRARFDRAAALWRRCTELAELPAGSSGWVLLSGPAERWYGRMAAGHLARMDGDQAGAAARYREACALLEGLDRDERHSIGVDAAIATALLFQGGVTDPAASRPLLRRALAHAQEAGDRRLLALVLDVMAGRAEDAVRGAELLGAAEGVRAAAGGPLPTVEQRAVEGVALALRTELGDEAYEAAVARGRDNPFAVVYAAGRA
jgi:tetratricopeptide (TPR) repeat protein